MSQAPRFAVLFKTHFWDDFVERQFRRLCLRAGGGRVFVIVDETHGTVGGIQHDDVIRITEAVAESEGCLRFPAGNVFWYNTDYQIYHFFEKFPDFKHVFICEYDCVVNRDLIDIVEVMDRYGLGFVGEPIRTPPEQWPWAERTRPFYQVGLAFTGRLVCCAAFSRDFALQLQAARRDHGRRIAEGTLPCPTDEHPYWPNNEAFVGAELARLGVADAPLSAFGDMSSYDWGPPHPELALPHLTNRVAVHPVLDGQRYCRAIRKFGWNSRDLFEEETGLRREMERYPAAEVVQMFLDHFCSFGDAAAIGQLRAYAEGRLDGGAEMSFNVARGKPATQSSISPWSRGATPVDDAAGAVSGRVSGGFGFHTDLDPEPWWCVDLQAVMPVREIRIHNRLDVRERARGLVVRGSADLIEWTLLFRHDGESDFGGADGMPLRIQLSEAAALRFLRVHLPRTGVLHLDEVEVLV